MSTDRPILAKVQAVYEYDAEEANELSIREGDIIMVYKRESSGWWKGQGPSGKIGHFPSNFVEVIEEYPQTQTQAPPPIAPKSTTPPPMQNAPPPSNPPVNNPQVNNPPPSNNPPMNSNPPANNPPQNSESNSVPPENQPKKPKGVQVLPMIPGPGGLRPTKQANPPAEKSAEGPAKMGHPPPNNKTAAPPVKRNISNSAPEKSAPHEEPTPTPAPAPGPQPMKKVVVAPTKAPAPAPAPAPAESPTPSPAPGPQPMKKVAVAPTKVVKTESNEEPIKRTQPPVKAPAKSVEEPIPAKRAAITQSDPSDSRPKSANISADPKLANRDSQEKPGSRPATAKPNLGPISANSPWPNSLPPFEEFCTQLTNLFEETKSVTDGQNHWYPHLNKIDSELFGFAVCSVGGKQFAHGDSEVNFTLHGASFPFALVLAYEDGGEQKLNSVLGTDPCATPDRPDFNEENKIYNGFTDAGAIVVGTQIKGDGSAKIARILDKLSHASSSRIGCSMPAYCSINDSDYNHMALGFWMKSHGKLGKEVDVEKSVQFLRQISSIEVDCKQAASITATLANNGNSPFGNKPVFDPKAVHKVNAQLVQCGLHGDTSDETKIPAKGSGSGILLMIIPNVCGIAVYSPRVDDQQVCTRGLQFCKAVLQNFPSLIQ